MSNPVRSCAMMFSLFYFSFWCIMRGANFARPSALHRAYAHIWLFALAWIVLVAVTVSEDRYGIASGYIFVFWASQAFLATLVSLLDLFALPKMQPFAQGIQEDNEVRDHLESVPHSDAIMAPSPGEIEDESAVHDEDSVEEEPPNERSPLVGGVAGGLSRRTTFATGYRRSIPALVQASRPGHPGEARPKAFGFEQEWSGYIPTWTWFFQFLILAPMMIILATQLGLLTAFSMNQTGTDGSDTLTPYMAIAIFCIFVVIPITPFIHRVTRHIPLLLAAVFAGALVYSLLVFPFSATSPYKIYFSQHISLDTGQTRVTFTGYEEYTRMVIANMPSAMGKSVSCSGSSGRTTGLVGCTYDGSAVPPNPGQNVPAGIPPQTSYSKLVTINATRRGGENEARIEINAVNTKTCLLRFKKPVTDIFVHDSLGWDQHFPVPEEAEDGRVWEFALWRRDWETPWVVDVKWDDKESNGANQGPVEDLRAENDELKRRSSGLDGEVVARWADANTPGVVPAIDQAWQYAPSWAIVSVRSKPALVEGSKTFMI